MLRAFSMIVSPVNPPKLTRALRAPLLGVLLALALLALGFSDGLASEPTTLAQQGIKLTGSEEVGQARFGRAAALSADGDTALIGAPRDIGETGAAWVFTRSGSTWTPQVKLTAPDEAGAARFGRSVALSADGGTAVVGGPNDGGSGAVWVFTRSGSTWTEQAKLTAAEESGSGWFGSSVAISADGSTVLVGGFVDHSDAGAAWVFARSGSAWSQQGAKLTGSEENGEGEFGWSVALSRDGDTALVGGHGDAQRTGAAWVFARSGSAWSQQGAKLTGSDGSGEAEFGQSVALSGDGQTALVGGRGDEERFGAAWVFVRSGSAWSQQGAKLTGSDGSGEAEFGQSVALSGDGQTALVGGRGDTEGLGAAWVFARSGSAWVQSQKLTGSEERGKGELGWSAALSADGTTALLGGIDDAAKVGAAWVFAPAPPGAPSGGGTPPGSQGQPTPSGGGVQTTASQDARQEVAGFKAAAGRVVLIGRRIRVKHGAAKVTLRCASPVACRGALALAVKVVRQAARRASLTIGTANLAIRQGRTATVRLLLTREGRSRLSSSRRALKASLAVHVSVPHPTSTHAYSVVLVLRPS